MHLRPRRIIRSPVDVFEASEDLVHEVLAVLVAEVLVGLDDLVEVRVHDLVDDVDVIELVIIHGGPKVKDLRPSEPGAGDGRDTGAALGLCKTHVRDCARRRQHGSRARSQAIVIGKVCPHVDVVLARRRGAIWIAQRSGGRADVAGGTGLAGFMSGWWRSKRHRHCDGRLALSVAGEALTWMMFSCVM